MSAELVNLISKRFIARPDVKAIQYSNGSYSPVRTKNADGSQGENVPWTRDDLNAHLAGTRTHGHYLINTDDTCKLFVFDIDLEKSGWLPTEIDEYGVRSNWQQVEDLRAAWKVRDHPARDYMKVQFRLMAHELAVGVQNILGLDTAVAYSGNKGVHVYGFMPAPSIASDVRDGALLLLDNLGKFEPKTAGNSIFFRHTNQDSETGFPNMSIEVYPKQDSIGNKDLGNLVRLPLGRNQKSPDPTFFVDMTAALNQLRPTDPIRALTPGNKFLADA